MAPPVRWSRRLAAAVALSTLSAAVAAPVGAEDLGDPSPTQWPDNAVVTARMQGAANALRLSGLDRYQTALAMSLTGRGVGGFGFSSPDRTSNGAPDLAAADRWWGLDRCPRAIIVVAGDSPADALAASALSDPTGESSEPFLERTASADPLFEPVGGFARVDTDAAPILVTRAARQGATALTPATRLAAQDLRDGGCTSARQAIIVGGTQAVPADVEAELLSIGYAEVFRVSGPTRYATAAEVARSLGTASRPAGVGGCAHPDATVSAAMRFYANSVVEYRPTATTCQLLERTVVLADGVTGADALAAGWWTSFFQVPVLLHNGSGVLPVATAEALATLNVENIIVLGGRARISDVVVAEARDLAADATAIRVAGDSRYTTSVAMAENFGGWFAAAGAARFAGSMLCVAASSGDGATAKGWPDALAGGPFCGSANGAAADPRAPVRALGPVAGATPRLTSDTDRPGRDAVPIVLVPFGATSLPEPVATWMTAVFSPSATWCTSAAVDPACVMPGFALVLGGSAALGPAVMADISRRVAGESVEGSAMARPVLDPPFVTALDMSPVYAGDGSAPWRACAGRGTYAEARWLTVEAPTSRPIGSVDVYLDRLYRQDADATERTPGVGAPVCVGFDPGTVVDPVVRATGIAGWVSTGHRFSLAPTAQVRWSGPLSSPAPQSPSGSPSDVTTPGASTTLTYTSVGGGVVLQSATGAGPVSTPITTASVTFTLTRGPGTAPTTFSGTWTIDVTAGSIAGTMSGEAVLVDDVWQLRGRVAIGSGPPGFDLGIGGFSATLDPRTPGVMTDDSLTWRLDWLVPQPFSASAA